VYSDQFAQSLVELHRYSFAEFVTDGRLRRVVRTDKGTVATIDAEKRQSRYEHQSFEQAASYLMVVREDLIRDSATGTVMGVFRDFDYYGGWFSQAMLGAFGQQVRRRHCQSGAGDYGAIELIKQTLKPLS
jgi:hypothetical protein